MEEQLPATSFDGGEPIWDDLPCRKCGYNLRGFRAHERCQWCGIPVAQSIPARPPRPIPIAKVAFDSAGAIGIDLPCLQCGYNLRGLHPDVRCPECGTSVSRSMQGNLLRFAHPEWVKRVSLGLRVLLWMIPAGLIAGLLASIVPGTIFHQVLGRAIVAAGCYGAWLLSAAEPGGSTNQRVIRARKIVRVALLVALAGDALLALAVHSPQPVTLVAVVVFATVSRVGFAVGAWGLFILYENFAARIPDEAMERRARFLRFAFVIPLAVTAVSNIKVASPSATVWAICNAIERPAGIGVFVFGLMTLGLLLRLNKALKEQAAIARQTWAADSAMPNEVPRSEI